MPSLFISYKRGTSAVIPLIERLRAAYYRVWYDKVDIRTGDNWREAINRGVDACDALLICLTPAACQSEFVQHEVKRALEKKKLIFPLKFEILNEIDDLKHLGLTDRQFLDFTAPDSDTWDKAFKKLLEDMQPHKNLQVSSHTKRQQGGTGENKRHQRYLKDLIERIGNLSLANINPENSTVRLEDVYIDSPTDLSLSIDVQDWHVIDWWLAQDVALGLPQGGVLTTSDGNVLVAQQKGKKYAEDLGFDRRSFEILIGEIDAEIAAYREAHPEYEEDDLPWKDDWNDQIKENLVAFHTRDLVAASSRLVVLGLPGSGKSTFVKYLALCLAGEQIDGWERETSLSHLPYWPHGALTPIYVELRRFVASKHFPHIDTQPSSENFWSYIEHEILGTELINFLPELKADVENGRAIIILDGLDEVPYPEGKLKARQKQLVSLAEVLNGTRFAASRVVVTTRPYAYENWALPQFQTIRITAFNNKHQLDLAKKLFKASGMTEISASEKAEALQQQLRKIDPQLKDRPLFLTLMATLYLNGAEDGIPTKPGTLYHQSVMLLLDRWTQSKVDAPSLLEILGDMSVDKLYERLAELAYEVHSQSGEQQGTDKIEESLLYKHLKPLGRRAAVGLIPYLSENAGVLISPGQDTEKDVFHFAHRTFQEYLAAVHICKICLEADNYKLLNQLITSKPQLWRLPISLVGDILSHTRQKSKLWALLGDLLEDEAPQERYSMSWWLAWFGAQIVEEQELYLEKGLNRRTEQPVHDALVQWLRRLIEQEALEPIERASCGNVLGLLGDFEEGVGLRHDGLPDIKWGKEIKAASYTIGMKETDFSYLDFQEITLKHGYRLAKYPVTVIQFQAFVDATDGMRSGEWWNELETQNEPDDLDFKYSNHPCINVSWYQAVAFCRWLTKKYRDAGLLEAGLEIRLPTEQEWEIAARYPDGRFWPYGNEEDLSKMNAHETGIYWTTAVGSFPSGRNEVLDLWDLVGNVWEWCLTKYEDGSNLIDTSGDIRVIRGGSVTSDSMFASAVARYYDYPTDPKYMAGFRLCVSAKY
jgi:formylglycine-generating enzyme required for sulfatase activity